MAKKGKHKPLKKKAKAQVSKKNKGKKDDKKKVLKEKKSKSSAKKKDKKQVTSVQKKSKNKSKGTVAESQVQTVPKKRGRPPKKDKKEKKVVVKPVIPASTKPAKYLVKLKIDAKTIIFVKDEKSLKKWKALYPNAEEVI